MSGWDHPDPFLLRLRVLPEHIDVLDHANNTVYPQWCQDVGWAHSTHLGMPPSAYRALDRAMVLRHAHYEYILPALCGDEIDAGTWLVASDGRLNMRRHFQLRRASDGVTLLRGDWELVCIRISTGRATRMPPEFLAAYQPAVTNPSSGFPA
jgi:acyl-CoA thioester hydrolase